MMKLHITTGTLGYMASMKEKNPSLMMNARDREAMLYIEDEEAAVFASGYDYEILHSHGSLSEDHTIYVQYIPVSGSGNISILGHLSDLNQKLQNIRGLQAYRIGQSDDEGTFIVFTQWPGKSTISDFKSSDAYRDYLTTDVLKRFRDAGAMFHSFSASKIYLPADENEKELSERTEDEEDY